jgi:hypothetical protein
MNEIIQEKLKQLNDDDLMLQAITFFFNEGIERQKPNIESSAPNEIIGEQYRAYSEARNILEKILIEIKLYKDNKVTINKFNKGK